MNVGFIIYLKRTVLLYIYLFVLCIYLFIYVFSMYKRYTIYTLNKKTNKYINKIYYIDIYYIYNIFKQKYRK